MIDNWIGANQVADVATDQVRVSQRSPEQLDSLRSDTAALIDRIRAETEFAPRTGPLCRWCEYRDGCSASPMRQTDVPSYEHRAQLQTAARAVASAALSDLETVPGVSATVARRIYDFFHPDS